MSAWPSPKVIAAAMRGQIAEVVRLPSGVNVRGIRSASKNVFAIVAPSNAGVVCTKCEAEEAMPAAPTSRGLNGKPEPLFSPGSIEHATFMLTWLSRFSNAHGQCRKRKKKAAAPTVEVTA